MAPRTKLEARFEVASASHPVALKRFQTLCASFRHFRFKECALPPHVTHLLAFPTMRDAGALRGRAIPLVSRSIFSPSSRSVACRKRASASCQEGQNRCAEEMKQHSIPGFYLHVTAHDLREAAEKHPIARLAHTVASLLPDVKLPLQRSPTAFPASIRASARRTTPDDLILPSVLSASIKGLACSRDAGAVQDGFSEQEPLVRNATTRRETRTIRRISFVAFVAEM